MKPVLLIGAGPSLRVLSPQEREIAAGMPSIATSVYVRWPDAWEPWGYVVNDPCDIGALTAEVDIRWPKAKRFYHSLFSEKRTIKGWTWFERSPDCKAETGTWDPILLSTSMGMNPLWYAAQIAARLEKDWDTFILLGAEHTPTGYAHDLDMPQVRNLSLSRYEGQQVAQWLEGRGITLLDASGPTSTLKIPRIALADILPVTVP